MTLANEDALRINVLLRQNTLAIRVDEATMTVHALTTRGEAKVKLHPHGQHPVYLRHIRETVSSHVLGSPRGYPVFMKQWTRMGQARTQSLEQLLLIAEPEAVVAVVHAHGLTDELARRAWWCLPNAENARQMLANANVVRGNMGAILTDFLVEFLPFETESKHIIDTVRLLLQPGLLNAQSKLALWRQAAFKNSYYVGFLLSCPQNMPDLGPCNPAEKTLQSTLTIPPHPNKHRALLAKFYSAAGQTFLRTVRTVLKKPKDQDTVVMLLLAIERYVTQDKHHPCDPCTDMTQIQSKCQHLLDGGCAQISHLAQSNPLRIADLCASLLLWHVSEHLVTPIFSRSNAIGTVMRRQLAPLSLPMLAACEQLLGESG